MEPWSNAAEFEALAAKVVAGGNVWTSMGVTTGDPFGTDVHTSPSVPPGKMYYDPTASRLFVGADTASQIRFAADLTGVQKQEKPMSQKNTKTFEVVYEDGTTELVPAQTSNEVEGRLTFTGFVEGVEDSYGNTVIKSVKADNVKSYRVVPKPEQDAKAVGKNTYRVNLVDGTAKDVKADHVLFQAGNGDKAGRYSLVTNVRGGENRTEYIIGEDRVDSVERLTEDGESTVLVDNKADASA